MLDIFRVFIPFFTNNAAFNTQIALKFTKFEIENGRKRINYWHMLSQCTCAKINSDLRINDGVRSTWRSHNKSQYISQILY